MQQWKFQPNKPLHKSEKKRKSTFTQTIEKEMLQINKQKVIWTKYEGRNTIWQTTSKTNILKAVISARKQTNKNKFISNYKQILASQYYKPNYYQKNIQVDYNIIIKTLNFQVPGKADLNINYYQ